MADFTLFGEITGDSSNFQAAVDAAKGSLSGFAETAAGVFAGVGALGFFNSLTTGIQGLVSNVVGTASDFQEYGQTFTNTLGNMAQAGTGMGDSVSAGAAQATASALEAQDALIRYNEKITSINDNIATVMQGQNVLDAQTRMYDQLGTLAQNYADKVQSINDQIDQANQDLATREENRQQNMSNSLQDMQLSHADQVANTTEQYQQKMSMTNSQVVKTALQKELDDKLKLMNDSYERQYATKETELKRNMDQQNAADEKATANKISKFQSEIDKENALYDQQVKKVKDDSDKKIETLKEENAKKLAMYQQELADEERSYQLSLAKRAASAASGGTGGKGTWSFGVLSQMEQGQAMFLNMNESAEKLQYNIQQFAQTAPFNLHDIEKADQGFAAVGLNVEKMNPIITDLAGHWHTSIATASQAIMDEIAGNGRMMAMNFHLTKEEIQDAFGKDPIKSVNDLMTAFQNLDENAKLRGSFKGGRMAAFETLPGQMSNIQDQFAKFSLAIMGIGTDANNMGHVIKGGLFDLLFQALQGIANFMSGHQDQMVGFFNGIGQGIVQMVKYGEQIVTYLSPYLQRIMKDFGQLLNDLKPFTPELEGLAKLFGVALVLSLQLVLGALDIVIQAVDGLVKAADALINAWNKVKDFFGGLDNNFKNFAKNSLSYLDPHARHSPSLIDQVTSGVEMIKQTYATIGDVNIKSPTMPAPAMVTNSSQNYNTNNNFRTNNVTMNNSFNVTDQGNLQNVAEYMGFQLEHYGVV